MSEMERHIGKIRKVDLVNYTIEEWCEKKCKSIGIGLDECYKSYEDISILTPNNDGTYSYIMQFYNGGACLSEMLEDGIKNIKEE